MGMVDLLYLFAYCVYEDKQIVRFLKDRVSECIARPVRPINDAAPHDGGVVAKLL